MLHSNSICIEHGKLYGKVVRPSLLFSNLWDFHSGSSDAILNLLNQNLSPSGSFAKCDSQFIESLFISIRIICPNAILLVRRVFPNVIACLSSNVAMSNVEALCCAQLVCWGCLKKGCPVRKHDADKAKRNLAVGFLGMLIKGLSLSQTRCR